jgi:uncharacterized membrane protein YqaE (UPF0057 family)
MQNEKLHNNNTPSRIYPIFKLKYLDKTIITTNFLNTEHTLKTLFTEQFTNINNLINKPLKKYYKKYYISNGKLINPNTKLNTLINIYYSRYTLDCKLEYITIECFDSVNGGVDFLDMILKPIETIFMVIFKPIGAIGNVFIFILQMFIWLVKFIYWSIFFFIWLFSDLLNPIKLISDFWNSIILILVTIFSTVMNVLMGIIAVIINSVGGWMQGFWGWEQSGLTKNDKNSNYFKGIDRVKGKKCYLTNSNTVPFSILLGTILCPPIGVFMDMGITGWFNIFICAILTVLFYVPGLFYALLVIYS